MISRVRLHNRLTVVENWTVEPTVIWLDGRHVILRIYGPGRHRLVEERQVEVFDVHEFELGVGTLLCDFVNSFGHGLAVATGSCTSDDDGDSECFHNFDVVK